MLIIPYLFVTILLSIAALTNSAIATSEILPDNEGVKRITLCTVEDVIKQAETCPKKYEIGYLKSEVGKKHIQQLINTIHKDERPEGDEIKNYGNIGRYVSREYEKRFQNLSPVEQIIEQIELWERLKDGTLKVTSESGYFLRDDSTLKVMSHRAYSLLKQKNDIPEDATEYTSLRSSVSYLPSLLPGPEDDNFIKLKLKLIPSKFSGICVDYALTKILGVNLERNFNQPSRYQSPTGSGTEKYEGIICGHVMHCLQTLFIQVQEPKQNDLVVYYDDKNNEVHFGIYCMNGIIESKWGRGEVYQHLPFYVHDNYGNTIKFYRLNYNGSITEELLKSLSDSYVEQLRKRHFF